MGILTWIILGALAGAIGKLIMPGDDPGGFSSPYCLAPTAQ